MEAGLIISRFLHYFAVVLAFGTALFPFYTWRKGESVPLVLGRPSALVIAAAVILAILSGAAWFIFTVNSMADSATGFLDYDTVHYTAFGTAFGRLWVGRAAIASLLAALTIAQAIRAQAGRSFASLSLAAVLLMTLAGTGHTQTTTGATHIIQTGSDGIHLLSAGAWLGGLVPLAIITVRGIRTEAETALVRFSGMGYLAVGLLFATGVVNGATLVGSFANLFSTRYGQLLLAKVGVFLAMVTLAGANRFLLVPALARQNAHATLSHLQGHIVLEQILGVAVLAIVSGLGTLEPPMSPA